MFIDMAVKPQWATIPDDSLNMGILALQNSPNPHYSAKCT